jgi:acyl carrier protein
MTEQEIRRHVLESLASVAPDIDQKELDHGLSLRDSYGLDSMDFLNLLSLLYERIGIDVGESEAGKLASVNDIVSYYQAR